MSGVVDGAIGGAVVVLDVVGVGVVLEVELGLVEMDTVVELLVAEKGLVEVDTVVELLVAGEGLVEVDTVVELLVGARVEALIVGTGVVLEGALVELLLVSTLLHVLSCSDVYPLTIPRSRTMRSETGNLEYHAG